MDPSALRVGVSGGEGETKLAWLFSKGDLLRYWASWAPHLGRVATKVGLRSHLPTRGGKCRM